MKKKLSSHQGAQGVGERGTSAHQVDVGGGERQGGCRGERTRSTQQGMCVFVWGLKNNQGCLVRTEGGGPTRKRNCRGGHMGRRSQWQWSPRRAEDFTSSRGD